MGVYIIRSVHKDFYIIVQGLSKRFIFYNYSIVFYFVFNYKDSMKICKNIFLLCRQYFTFVTILFL